MLMQAAGWFFRDRDTGRIVIAQWPNLALWVFIFATLIEMLTGHAGSIGLAVRTVAMVALVIWAADELVRGVNPWRRCLGAAVLIGEAIRFVV